MLGPELTRNLVSKYMALVYRIYGVFVVPAIFLSWRDTANQNIIISEPWVCSEVNII